MMSKGLIITGGSINETLLKKISKESAFRLIIAVDGGLEKAHECNIPLDIIVGDFDTVKYSLIKEYEEAIANKKITTKIVRLNPEKDMSDTQVAMELAMEYGINELVIIGAIGTRFDHTLANIHLLSKALEVNMECCILDDNNRISVLTKNQKINKRDLYGPYISFLPLTEKVTGVTLKGFKYPLESYTMTIGNSIGISNEAVKEELYVEIGKGKLIMIEARD